MEIRRSCLMLGWRSPQRQLRVSLLIPVSINECDSVELDNLVKGRVLPKPQVLYANKFQVSGFLLSTPAWL